MKLKFSEGKEGYTEAENFVRIARQLSATGDTDRLRDELERHARDHLANDQQELSRVDDALAAESSSWVTRVSATWHRIWGPTSAEMELSKQRSDALDRADRAERSSFESLAEMSRVGRERDAAIKQLKVLQQRLDDLESGKDK